MKFNSGKLKDKKAVIGIIGLGYVGLPLLIRYSEVGYKVIGFVGYTYVFKSKAPNFIKMIMT